MKGLQKQILIQAIKLEIKLLGKLADSKETRKSHTPRQMLECAIEFLELGDFLAVLHFVSETKYEILRLEGVSERSLRLFDLELRLKKEFKFC